MSSTIGGAPKLSFKVQGRFEMFYIISIAGGSFLITLGNFIADGIYTASAFFRLLFAVFLGVVAVIAIDGVLAFLIRRLPVAWFAPDRKLFSVSEGERRLYRKTRINRWKKYVPELGCFTGFHKDRLREPANSAYVGRFLLESHYGVVGHIAGALFGFLILLLSFLRTLTMALPIAVINFVLNILPTMILRYNDPALLRLYNRNRERDLKHETVGAQK